MSYSTDEIICYKNNKEPVPEKADFIMQNGNITGVIRNGGSILSHVNQSHETNTRRRSGRRSGRRRRRTKVIKKYLLIFQIMM